MKASTRLDRGPHLWWSLDQLRASLINWAEGWKTLEAVPTPPAKKNVKENLKTASLKGFESSPTRVLSRLPPPVIATTPLIIPKVCNSLNPNFEGAFCSGGDILSVQ